MYIIDTIVFICGGIFLWFFVCCLINWPIDRLKRNNDNSGAAVSEVDKNRGQQYNSNLNSNTARKQAGKSKLKPENNCVVVIDTYIHI